MKLFTANIQIDMKFGNDDFEEHKSSLLGVFSSEENALDAVEKSIEKDRISLKNTELFGDVADIIYDGSDMSEDEQDDIICFQNFLHKEDVCFGEQDGFVCSKNFVYERFEDDEGDYRSLKISYSVFEHELDIVNDVDTIKGIIS